MTKQEFEERYGREVGAEMFDNINDLYMNAGDMDKDTFVRDYKEHEESALLNAYYNKAIKNEKELARAKETIQVVAQFLIEKGAEWQSQGAFDLARQLIGEKATVLYKLESGIAFNDADKEYINRNLR